MKDHGGSLDEKNMSTMIKMVDKKKLRKHYGRRWKKIV
jgi:hypothetical protein